MKYKVVTVIVNLLDDPPTFSEARTHLVIHNFRTSNMTSKKLFTFNGLQQPL